MKLYEIRKIQRIDGCTLFSTYATETGLSRMGATVQNGGRSSVPTLEGVEVARKLAAGSEVLDPHNINIAWTARCLGDQFNYCRGILYPTPSQLVHLLEVAKLRAESVD